MIGYTNHGIAQSFRRNIQKPRQIDSTSGTARQRFEGLQEITLRYLLQRAGKSLKLRTGSTLYCYLLFHVLSNKLFELKEILIPFLLLLALELNAILTQYYL